MIDGEPNGADVVTTALDDAEKDPASKGNDVEAIVTAEVPSFNRITFMCFPVTLARKSNVTVVVRDLVHGVSRSPLTSTGKVPISPTIPIPTSTTQVQTYITLMM